MPSGTGASYRGEYLEGSVVVFDKTQSRSIYSLGFFGKPLGIPKPKGTQFDEPLVLDLIEARYLMEEGYLEVYRDGVRMSTEELIEAGRASYSKYEELYLVYRDLRKRGYYVSTGIKFGSDFAVYVYGPGIDHAPFIVLVRSKEEELWATDIVRAGRLSTTVRKNFLIATPDLEKGLVRYLSISWARM
ncbi:MAG: tRNA-intron lyase [Thaumarchaeota archaeon]|nr:tRNA-intron lyase [Candidatus Calditenuaceae archaeon]MDW8041203.1 tRNA-intron lyase [Nitrososphaerota archaeon]